MYGASKKEMRNEFCDVKFCMTSYDYFSIGVINPVRKPMVSFISAMPELSFYIYRTSSMICSFNVQYLAMTLRILYLTMISYNSCNYCFWFIMCNCMIL